MTKYVFIGLILGAGITVAVAGPHHHAPSQAAIDACAKSKQGDTCSFTGHRGAMSGTCELPHEASGSGAPVLACRPANMGHGGSAAGSSAH